MTMKKWKYHKLHIPYNCACEQRSQQVFIEETIEEMMELEFLQTLARYNYMGRGHWQYWV